MRGRFLLGACGAVAAAAMAGGPADGAIGARGAACPAAEVRTHDEVVLGHFPQLGEARALMRRALGTGFKGATIENDGCRDYEVELDGADNPAGRTSFASEAGKAGFQVTFEQIADPSKPGPGQVVGILAEFGSLSVANALASKLAAADLRYTDIVYKSGRWLVVMPEVPVKAVPSLTAEVRRAGYRIVFRGSA
jgi:hypothetical protein